MKNFDSGIRSKENMVMILVHKRSAAMRGLRKSLRKPRGQLGTWLTSIDQVNIKEPEQNLKFRSVRAVRVNVALEVIKKLFVKEGLLRGNNLFHKWTTTSSLFKASCLLLLEQRYLLQFLHLVNHYRIIEISQTM